MASVTISGLRKNFGRTQVLKGIDLEVADGEFVAILGESGCGKSTLLRIVAGLEDETAGHVLIGGRDVSMRTPSERGVAMVFQSYALYPHMSVRGNIAFPLEVAGVPRAEIGPKVERAAELLGLEAHLDKRPRELSGGQRQRVAMGRAIVREPSVFLFDEPLSNLDAMLRVQMRGEIRELQRRLGTTVIYVIHDQVEALTMADRVVLMRDGMVEQVGEPLDLYDYPATLYVAGFVGSPPMNVLRAGREDGRLRVPGLAVAFAVEGSAGDCDVGVRPEHVRPCREGEADALGRLVSLETTGDRTFAVVEIGGQRLKVATAERLTARPGEPIPLCFEAAAWHGFDRALPAVASPSRP